MAASVHIRHYSPVHYISVRSSQMNILYTLFDLVRVSIELLLDSLTKASNHLELLVSRTEALFLSNQLQFFLLHSIFSPNLEQA